MSQNIGQILDEWRRLERTAIGLSDPIIRARIDKRQEIRREIFTSRDEEGQEQVFERYVSIVNHHAHSYRDDLGA